MSKSGFFYAVATRTGCGIFRSWDECLSFLQAHPGAEFHKKHRTWEAAEKFMKEKCEELGYKREEFNLRSVEQKMPGPVVPAPATVEDDEPPW